MELDKVGGMVERETVGEMFRERRVKCMPDIET